MVMSVRRTRGMAHRRVPIRHKLGTQILKLKRSEVVRDVQATTEKREEKQRSKVNMAQYAGVVQWQNISFPSWRFWP